MTAIVLHDLGARRDARAWFETAARAAKESGDSQLHACVLAREAMVPLNYGTPQTAARLAEQGVPVAELCGRWHVLPCVRKIHDAHVAVPGLAVVEVAAADDATAFAVQALLAARCAIAPADRTTREPGEPGVRLRCFVNLHPEPDT